MIASKIQDLAAILVPRTAAFMEIKDATPDLEKENA